MNEDQTRKVLPPETLIKESSVVLTKLGHGDIDNFTTSSTKVKPEVRQNVAYRPIEQPNVQHAHCHASNPTGSMVPGVTSHGNNQRMFKIRRKKERMKMPKIGRKMAHQSDPQKASTSSESPRFQSGASGKVVFPEAIIGRSPSILTRHKSTQQLTKNDNSGNATARSDMNSNIDTNTCCDSFDNPDLPLEQKATSSSLICGLQINHIDTKKQTSEVKQTAISAETINRGFSSVYSGINKGVGRRVSDLRIGLGYDNSLDDIQKSKSVLGSLTVLGSGVQTNGKGNDQDCDEDGEEEAFNPTKRQRTVPTILARSRSRNTPPTVRELLKQRESKTQNKESLTSPVPPSKSVYKEDSVDDKTHYIPTGRSMILPSTIPSKRSSIDMSISGKQMELPLNPTPSGISDYSLSSSMPNSRLTRRYKNTRYSLPFKGPSMIVPKNYDKLLTGSVSAIGRTSSFLLPKLGSSDSHSIHRPLKDTGKVTSLPTMTIGTIGALSVSPIPLPPRSNQPSQESLPNQYEDVRLSLNLRSSAVDSSKSLIGQPKPAPASKLPNLQVNGIRSVWGDNNQPVGFKSTDHVASEGKKGQKPEFTCLRDYHRLALGASPTQEMKKTRGQSLGVYHHPIVGKISDMISHTPLSVKQSSTPVESSPVPSSSYVNPHATRSTPNSSSSSCFYCEVERIVSDANLEVENDLPSTSDHAYNKTPASSPCKMPSVDISQQLLNVSSKDNLPAVLEKTRGNQIPVYAFKYGEQLVLVPSMQPSFDPITPSTTPDIGFQRKKHGRLGRGRKKRSKLFGKRRKNIYRKYAKVLPKVSPTKLEFARLVELSPNIARKQKRSNLERVIANIQRSKDGIMENGATVKTSVAKVIQIERSPDDVFTQINHLVQLEFHEGNDPLLKRWHEFEDYYARIVYDNVSGAIRKIEADTLRTGFYRIYKTGMLTSDDRETKTLATMQCVIATEHTVLNDLSFIAIGKIVPDTNRDIPKLPANIQKHTNLDYLLRAISSVCVTHEEIDHVSDRSYLPKVDSPKWYSTRLYDKFTREHQHSHKQTTSVKIEEVD